MFPGCLDSVVLVVLFLPDAGCLFPEDASCALEAVLLREGVGVQPAVCLLFVSTSPTFVEHSERMNCYYPCLYVFPNPCTGFDL